MGGDDARAVVGVKIGLHARKVPSRRPRGETKYPEIFVVVMDQPLIGARPAVISEFCQLLGLGKRRFSLSARFLKPATLRYVVDLR